MPNTRKRSEYKIVFLVGVYKFSSTYFFDKMFIFGFNCQKRLFLRRKISNSIKKILLEIKSPISPPLNLKFQFLLFCIKIDKMYQLVHADRSMVQLNF